MMRIMLLPYGSMLRNVDARGVPGIPWLINTQKLFEWANEVRIDPNDPDYSDLMEFIMYTRHKGQAIPKYFRLEQLQEEFNFVSEEEIKKNKRFQLLQLRNAGQLDVFVLQQMPLYDREIPDLVFQVLHFLCTVHDYHQVSHVLIIFCHSISQISLNKS
uniref:Uncharacterized protein n=1 Tax=Vombatus ursinus TaxID=29139 RepID=A0A4X2JNY5_VOMUR